MPGVNYFNVLKTLSRFLLKTAVLLKTICSSENLLIRETVCSSEVKTVGSSESSLILITVIK
ncbi:hypothetical protein Cri9333_4991 (plasmid) [Crinalium epipsammum PCC 9333]|uniref:Uncharacterized protein n=1 Tax=Crinalium epipsammum PCC 9333 TaxID=1173022 RepID=K9W6E3_9CYAN|nr:hypothetical protein Cri9333_4991 [Crinalium epipsammum PCC 9333]